MGLGRLQARWAPSDDLDVLLKLEVQKFRSQAGARNSWPTDTSRRSGQPGLPGLSGLHGFPRLPRHRRRPLPGGVLGGPCPYDVDQRAATLRVSDDLGWATLTSITGYVNFKRQWGADTDAGPFRQTDFVERDRINQVSQELRLSGAGERSDWLLGAFASRDRVEMAYDGALQDLFNTTTLTFSNQTSGRRSTWCPGPPAAA